MSVFRKVLEPGRGLSQRLEEVSRGSLLRLLTLILHCSRASINIDSVGNVALLFISLKSFIAS